MTAFQDLEERYSSGVYAKRGVTIVSREGQRPLLAREDGDVPAPVAGEPLESPA